ncbi:hypothetical protein Tco_0527429 [Tanacetum coccineum]
MDNPNITMEEYIRLEEEKARRHGKTFNWQTATFGKVKNYEDEDDCSIDFETKFTTIVFDNTLAAIPSEPKVCPPNENKVDFRISLDESDDEDYTYDEEIVSCFNDLFNIIHPDDSKSEKDNDDNNISIIQSSEGSFVMKLNIVIWEYYVNGMLFFLIINLYVPFGIPFDPKQYYKDSCYTKVTEAKIWHHYQLLTRDTHGSDTRFRSTLRGLGIGLTLEMRHDMEVRLRMVYSGEGHQVFVSHACRRLFGIRAPLLGGVRRRMTWRQFILALGLHTEQEMAEAGFGAYWAGSDRLIPDKGDLRDY